MTVGIRPSMCIYLLRCDCENKDYSDNVDNEDNIDTVAGGVSL